MQLLQLRRATQEPYPLFKRWSSSITLSRRDEPSDGSIEDQDRTGGAMQDRMRNAAEHKTRYAVQAS